MHKLGVYIRMGSSPVAVLGIVGVLLAWPWASAQGAPGDGIVVRNMTIHPYVELRGEYDTNPDASSQGSDSDMSATVRGGADLLNLTRQSQVSLHAWALAERYQDLDPKDHEDFGDELEIRLFDPTRLLVGISQTYADRTDFDTILGRDESRQDLTASGLLGKEVTDKVMAEAKYKYWDLSYDSDDLYGWQEHSAEGTLGHALTRRTTGTLTVRGAIQGSERGSEDGELGALHLGFRSRNSEKLIGYAGAGWLVYEVGDESTSTPSMDVGLTWRPRDPWRLELNALRTVNPSVYDPENFNTLTRVTLGGHYNIVRPVTLSLVGFYNQNNYERDLVSQGNATDWEDDTYVGFFRLTYHPGTVMQYFFEARAEDRDSSVAWADYSRELLSIGARATY